MNNKQIIFSSLYVVFMCGLFIAHVVSLFSNQTTIMFGGAAMAFMYSLMFLYQIKNKLLVMVASVAFLVLCVLTLFF